MSETIPKPPHVARIPKGAILKMLGGKFVVSSIEKKHLVLTGPLHRLKRGQILNLFGVPAQVTLVGNKLARLQVRGDAEFDTRPILKLEDDTIPEEPRPIPCPKCGETVVEGANVHQCDECAGQCCTACSFDGPNNTVICQNCHP